MKIYKRTQNLLYTSAETASAGQSDLTNVFLDVANRNFEAVKNKTGSLDLTLIYHQPNDEKKAEKTAETEVCEKLKASNKSVKFVRVNEDSIRELVSDKKLKEQAAEAADADKKDKSWIKTIIEFIIAILSFAAAIPSILTYVQNNKLVLGILMGVAIAVGIAFAVLSVLDIIKAVKRKKIALQETRKTLDISTACKWEKEDFNYKSQNSIFVFSHTSEGDVCWQAFKRYVQCLPRQIPLTCIIFKLAKFSTDNLKHFLDTFNGNKENNCDSDKSNFEKINENKKAKVFGFVLLPLNEEERRQLLEDLKTAHKHVSRGIANDGRDSLYRLVEPDGNFLDETNYFNFINDIQGAIGDKSQLTVDGVKRVLSFLATLKSMLALLPRNINVAGGSESDMFLNSKILQSMNAELAESSENTLKNTICFIWKAWQNDLIAIADREYSLLVKVDSNDGTLSPYKLAIESFLNYLSYLNPSARNDYYFAASSEIHYIIELIKSWHEANNKSLIAGYFASNYLDIFKDVLRLNSANGLYGNNYDLLKFIQQVVFADTRSTPNSELLRNVNDFYISEPVKTAFMHNAVVVPKTIDTDMAKYVGNMSNECREMHKAYLNERSKILGLVYDTVKFVPSYFELFGTCENSAEYYSLLRANNEQCVLTFFADLYRLCNDIAKSNILYFEYLKMVGEVDFDDVFKNEPIRCKTVEKLSACLFVEGQGSLLKDMLSGKPSGEELLSCGLLNCDVFFLLHDLYLLERHSKQFVFSDYITSKSYNFIDEFICLEYINSNKTDNGHRFSNMFTDLINLIAESGDVCFFAKYLYSIVNVTGKSDGNTAIIKQLLMNNCEQRIEIDENIQLKNEDIRKILGFCFGIKEVLGIEKLKQTCQFINSLPVTGTFAEEADIFIRYAVYEEDITFKDEAAEIKFVEKLKSFSNDFCYVIYCKVRIKKESLLKFSYLIADKLSRSTYVKRLLPLVHSIDYLDQSYKESVIRTIVDKIDYNIYDDNLLLDYNDLFVKYGDVIDNFKRQGFSVDMRKNIYDAVTTLRYKKSLDLYYHLNKDAGFLFLYAKNLLESMCALRVKSPSNTETDVKLIYSEINTIELTFEENGVRYVSKDYLSLINAIVIGKISNVESNVKLKIINDLIALLDADDNSVTIDKAVRQKHKLLLASIRGRV